MDNTTPKRKATSGKAANQDNAPANDITLLNKHLAVMFASTDRKLSGGDIAVLLQLMDYFNPRKGYAYPNMDTLAFNTNRTKRTIVDCIDRLENLGYLKIVRHGNRTTSNRYLPIFHEYVRPTKPDSDLDTTVQSTSPYTVQSTATIGAVQRNELVQSTSPNTTYEPAQQAGDIGGGVVITPPAATLPSPVGASQLASINQNATGLKYPEFWAVYPKRQNVSAANSEIAAALARGVSMATMVEAAAQYAVWIKSQPWQDKDKYTKGATNFIKQECWLEDYTVKPKEVKPKAGKVKATKAAKPKEKKTAKKPVEKKPTYQAKPIAPIIKIPFSSNDCTLAEIYDADSKEKKHEAMRDIYQVYDVSLIQKMGDALKYTFPNPHYLWDDKLPLLFLALDKFNINPNEKGSLGKFREAFNQLIGRPPSDQVARHKERISRRT